MRLVPGYGAILLALVVAAAGARGALAADDEAFAAMAGSASTAAEVTGSIDRLASTQMLPLSDEQRGLVFLAVTSLPDVPVVDTPAPQASDVLPETIELHELPAMVVRKVPLVREHKFVKVDDRILVVRPADRVVVVEIPRYRLVP